MTVRCYRELAEIMGQVKPPTATKEEIERAGLEVVQPTVLAQYEKEGRVASNCIEKVCFVSRSAERKLSMLLTIGVTVHSVSSALMIMHQQKMFG